MKSFIISAVVGTAILAIHGVNGAIIPDNAVKRAIPAAVSSATDISSRDVSTAAHVTPATACVHTGGGLVECTATLSKRAENAATALAMNNLDKRVPVIDSPLPTNQLNARADPGCHAKAKDFYFTPGAGAVCNAEIVKGSTVYRQYYPGITWNEGLMRLCFETAGCDGGLHLGE